MIYKNSRPPSQSASLVKRLFRTSSARPMEMLSQCPVYQATRLFESPELASEVGVAHLHLKDESTRMRLGSFKALGGAYAVAQMISDQAQTHNMESPEARQAAQGMTFMTASAGNHGLSVAAGARVFGARAVIYLSSSVPEGFANRIRSLDAEVVRVDGSYEDSVAAAKADAERDNGILLADGSWPGYIDRPALVMEGYTVLAQECRTVFEKSGEWPTQVLLQAGVGGLAASMAAHIRRYWPEQPTITIVEPDAAPCLLESVRAQKLFHVEGPLSNMGRLDCKDASLIAFESLRHDADFFVTITDRQATEATRRLAKHGIQTTPSGAASFAALSEIELEPSDRCLVIITEGPEEG